MSPRKPATLRTKWLGGHLRRLRDENGMTLADVAEYLNKRDSSSLSRFENGTLPIPAHDLEALFDLYGVDDGGTRDALRRLRTDAGGAAWWSAFVGDVSAGVIDAAWVESLATAIRAFSTSTIDGLLQTPDYAGAVMLAAEPNEPEERRTRWVQLRIMRQAVLNGAPLSAVLAEEVLHRVVGSPAVMANQLRHLLSQSTREGFELRVLPFGAGAHASPTGDFRIYTMPEPMGEVVCVDSPAGILYLEPPMTSSTVESYERLTRAALDQDDTRDLLRARADELESA